MQYTNSKKTLTKKNRWANTEVKWMTFTFSKRWMDNSQEYISKMMDVSCCYWILTGTTSVKTTWNTISFLKKLSEKLNSRNSSEVS